MLKKIKEGYKVFVEELKAMSWAHKICHIVSVSITLVYAMLMYRYVVKGEYMLAILYLAFIILWIDMDIQMFIKDRQSRLTMLEFKKSCEDLENEWKHIIIKTAKNLKQSEEILLKAKERADSGS